MTKKTKKTDDGMLKFLMEHVEQKDKEATGRARAKLFLGDTFEETTEQKASKKQRRFEENTFENFKVVHDEILETLQTLREFYSRSESELLEKEKLQKILADSEKLINEVVKKEQIVIDKLKQRLIDVIKEYDVERKYHRRKRRMLEKWIPRFVKSYNDSVDASRKYEKEIIENNRLTRELTKQINKYNDLIIEMNKTR